MTTIVPLEGPAEVINARRTESIDAPNILKLVSSSTEELFGRVNVVNLIEKAVLAVTLCNEKEEVLGHAAFFDYPNVDSIDQAEWKEWLNLGYDCSKCTPLNTLFLHYFVAKKEYALGCAREIIRTVFNAVPDLHYLFLNVPQDIFPDAALAEVFKPMKKTQAISNTLFTCNRHEHVPVLHIRHASVEDHDDLTPIFNRQSDMLKQTYGSYFLAELIEAQSEKMQCLVSEVEGTAVGFMSLCDDVNVQMLNECFEIGPFHGLRKPMPDDVVEAPKTPMPSPAPDTQEERCESRDTPHSDAGVQEPGEPDELKPEDRGESHVSAADDGHTSPVDEIKIRPKLSDAHMGVSSTSLLSDCSLDDNEHMAFVFRPASCDQAATYPASGTPKPATPHAQLPRRFIPTYFGEKNAFCIQLFCIDERYEMRSTDFMAKAFSLFPDCDFCVVTVPHLVPEFQLLQGFVRATPRCLSTLGQELYVFHRSGLLKDFNVRKACSKDFESIENLVNTIDLHENLLADLKLFNDSRRDADGTAIQAFVAESQGQIVGVSILRSEEGIEYIRSHYNIEDFIYYNHHARTEHGHLHHFAINPIFKHMSKHFLKEILRQSHKSSIYYPIYPPYASKAVVEKHSLLSVLNDLVPVRARRQIVYPENLGVNAPSERVMKMQEQYALYNMNRKLVLEPKVTINARIVVVGASDVGISFLETLLFCPHLRFNNLTLISPHGLPGEMAPDELRDQMLASSYCYSYDNYAKVSLRTSVNVVYGKMTSIRRKKKHIQVDNETIIPYDHLVLCTGQQYQQPAPLTIDLAQFELGKVEIPKNPHRRQTGAHPRNMFTVNDAYDSAIALYWVENNLMKSTGTVILYGNTLDTYCCVQTLLTLGLPAEQICLVEPPRPQQVSCFNNPDVERAVNEAMKDAGIKVYTDYVLTETGELSSTCDMSSATFLAAHSKPVQLDCAAFFAFNLLGVDIDAFKAINDACLVFDGKLVIDASFHTNDVAIRAAGPLTKFQRRYHAEEWTHANFNSKEIGMSLANAMLHLFDPTMEPEVEPPEEMLNLIPIYKDPKIQGGILPGGANYLNIAKPNLSVLLERQMAELDYGQELILGNVMGVVDYFRLHLNHYSSIQTITCLCKQQIPADNLISLYGVHQRYLNNIESRFTEGLIKSFYTFFMEPWCLAIYHDRFADFRDEVRELLITPESSAETVEERVRHLIDDDNELSNEQLTDIGGVYVANAKRAVEHRLLNFISYNYYHLPMYAKPGMV